MATVIVTVTKIIQGMDDLSDDEIVQHLLENFSELRSAKWQVKRIEDDTK